MPDEDNGQLPVSGDTTPTNLIALFQLLDLLGGTNGSPVRFLRLLKFFYKQFGNFGTAPGFTEPDNNQPFSQNSTFNISVEEVSSAHKYEVVLLTLAGAQVLRQTIDNPVTDPATTTLNLGMTAPGFYYLEVGLYHPDPLVIPAHQRHRIKIEVKAMGMPAPPLAVANPTGTPPPGTYAGTRTVSITASASGGTGPYSFQVFDQNSGNIGLPFSGPSTTVTLPPRMFPYLLKLKVTDSASSPTTVISANTLQYQIN